VIASRESIDVAWVPGPETVAHANLTSLMGRVGVERFDDLHAWSVDEPDAFWGSVISDLDLAFETPPSAIRGSTDVTDPDWLPGAVFNIVESCLDHDPTAVAVITGDSADLRSISVAELTGMVSWFAAGFARAGFEPGDAVAIVMPMTVEAVVAYLGTIAAGGVVVSVADSFAPHEIRSRFEIMSPVAVVTQDVSVRLGRTLDMYEKCIEAGAPTAIVVETGAGIDLRAGDIPWADFGVDGAPFSPVRQPASATTNVLFSSGTTGVPKAIPWTQTTPIKAAMDGRYHHDIHEGDVVAWPTNLGWMMGPWLIYAALLNRAAIALYDDAPTGRGFVEFVRDASVTMLGVVPSIVAAWRASGDVAVGDWTSVRLISSTGEAANADDSRWLMTTAGGIPVVEYCGGTEIGGGYISSTVLHPAVPARFTTATLGLDLVILDESGEPAEVGEVFLVPPSMGLSTTLLNRDHHEEYYAGVPQNGRTLRRHGDQLRRTDDGYIQALGRVDDTMNLGGIKVASGDLESAIGSVEGVAEIAAIGSAPPEGGPERLVLFAVPETGCDPDTTSVRNAAQASIRSALNPLFKVHDVVLVDELPRTASQKVMRRKLRDLYQS
jgi:acetyl-CoA synthetase